MTTVYDFELPKGYVDGAGEIYGRGKMRLAITGGEISAIKDPKVLGSPSYPTVVILSRVIVELEEMDVIAPITVEQLFTADLAFPQDMYQRVNDMEPSVMRVVCPSCGCMHEVPINFTREG